MHSCKKLRLSPLKIKTREITPTDLQDEIFEARGDLICHVVIDSERRQYSLEDTAEEYRSGLFSFTINAAVLGLGGYSKFARRKYSLMSHCLTQLREPTEKEQREGLETVCQDDSYTGQPTSIYPPKDRIRKMVFTTRVFPGDFPDNISSLIYQINCMPVNQQLETPNTLTTNQGYFFCTALQGNIFMNYFSVDVDPRRLHISKNLYFFGSLVPNDEGVTFYFHGDINKSWRFYFEN